MAEEQHESKIGLVNAGSKNPIALYSLIVVVAVGGLITAVTVIEPGLGQNAIILTIAVILIMIVYLVGTRALGKTVEVKERYPSHGETISQIAMNGWYDGGNASALEGIWKVHWYDVDEKGLRMPYKIKGKNDDLVEYPPEQARVKSKGAMISVENIDQTTGYIYFLEGRLSQKNIVTLTYWSQPGIKESALVGVLFLQLEDSFDKTVMRGEWIGYDRKGSITRGETEWNKIAMNVPNSTDA